MSIWKQFREHWPEIVCAAVGAPLLAVIVWTSLPAASTQHGPRNQIETQQGAEPAVDEPHSAPSFGEAETAVAKDGEAEEHKNEWPEFWIAIGTWALVFGTVALALFTFRLWRATKAEIDESQAVAKRQADEFKTSLDIARSAADAAKRSADAAEHSIVGLDRPILFMGEYQQQLFHEVPTARWVKYKITNAGRSPAIILPNRSWTMVHAVSKDAVIETTWNQPGALNPVHEWRKLEVILRGGHEKDVQTARYIEDAAKPSRVESGDIWIIFRGVIAYKDVLGNEWQRHFCLRFSKEDSPPWLPVGGAERNFDFQVHKASAEGRGPDLKIYDPD